MKLPFLSHCSYLTSSNPIPSLYFCYPLQISVSSVSVSFSLSVLLSHSIWAGGAGRHGNTTLQSPWGLWDRSHSCVDAASGRSMGLTPFPSFPLCCIFLAIPRSHTHICYCWLKRYSGKLVFMRSLVCLQFPLSFLKLTYLWCRNLHRNFKHCTDQWNAQI